MLSFALGRHAMRTSIQAQQSCVTNHVTVAREMRVKLKYIKLDAVLKNVYCKSENGRCLWTNTNTWDCWRISIIFKNSNFYLCDNSAPFLVSPSVLRADQVNKVILKMPQELLKHSSSSEIILEWLLICRILLFILSHSNSVSITCYKIVLITLTKYYKPSGFFRLSFQYCKLLFDVFFVNEIYSNKIWISVLTRKKDTQKRHWISYVWVYALLIACVFISVCAGIIRRRISLFTVNVAHLHYNKI